MGLGIKHTLIAIMLFLVTFSFAEYKHTLHFFSPWPTAPKIIIKSYDANDTEERSMKAEQAFCGWYSFEASSAQHYEAVIFTNGTGEYYGANGIHDMTPVNLTSISEGFYNGGEEILDRYLSFDQTTHFQFGSWRPNVGLNGPCRSIHLFSPWQDAAPKIIVGDNAPIGMHADTNNCGWYSTTLTTEDAFKDIHFSNRKGETYGNTGKGSISPIDASGALANGAEPYIHFDNGSTPPVISNSRPTTLTNGVCLSALMKGVIYDWNALDFGAFEPGDRACLKQTGLVEPFLGDDNLPTPTDKASECFAESVKEWFTPVTIGNETNRSCLDLKLTPSETGAFEVNHTVDYDDHTAQYGFYPIDNVESPKNSKTNGLDLPHNYHFCMKIETSFTYKPGQQFEFEGDDDMWIYINRKLALDIGGIHQPTYGKIDLDTLFNDSDIGETQDFRIFYCERQTDQSNLKIQTDIDFNPPQVYHHELDTAASTSNKEHYEIFEGYFLQQGGCSPIENSVNRVSNFYWSKDSILDDNDLKLDAGSRTFGGGISIKDNGYQFSIDYDSFDGIDEDTYYLFHKSISQGAEEIGVVTVTVSSYDYFLAFVNPNDPTQIYTREDLLDSMVLGSMERKEFAIQIFESYSDGTIIDTTLCESCAGSFNLDTGSPLFTIDNESFENGLYLFTLSSIDPIENATVSITFNPDASAPAPIYKGSRTITTSEITVLEYPNYSPAKEGSVYLDLNSDGTMDRIQLKFNTATTDSVLENIAIAFNWPHHESTDLIPEAGEITRVAGDSFSAYWDIPTDRFTILPYTTSIREPIYGTAVVWFQYPWMDDPDTLHIKIADKMAPVIVSAWLHPGTTTDTLQIELSEGVLTTDLFDEGNENYEFLSRTGNNFKVLPSDNNFFDESQQPFTTQRLLYTSDFEKSILRGDSVRLFVGNDRIQDSTSNKPDHTTRAVMIQAITPDITLLSQFTYIDPDTIQNDASNIFARHLPISMSEKLSDTEAGVQKPGNMKEILWHALDEYGKADTDPSEFYYEYTLRTYSTLGTFVNQIDSTVSCADPELFNGNCLTMDPDDIQGFAIYIPPFSHNNQLIATGVYIVNMRGKYRYKEFSVGRQEDLFKFGMMRKSE